MKKLRRITIVIQETSETHFDVFLDGDKERLETISRENMSPAEFYGSHFFEMCAGMLKEIGALKTVTLMKDMKKGAH